MQAGAKLADLPPEQQMNNMRSPRDWRRLFWRRREVVRTTWLFRGLAVLVFALVLVAVHRPVLTALARSLVHQGPVAPSDAIVLENYDPDYLVFEMARNLRRDGLAPRVIVPCGTFGGPTNLNDVAQGFVEVMVRVSRMGEIELLPVEPDEPITLHTATAVAEYLAAQGITSVIVVSPLFRSRRSHLVYQSVLEPMDISLTCVPARSIHQPESWWLSTHGIQNVLLEFGKLWYYRLIVL
jgi:hypothetical protein